MIAGRLIHPLHPFAGGDPPDVWLMGGRSADSFSLSGNDILSMKDRAYPGSRILNSPAGQRPTFTGSINGVTAVYIPTHGFTDTGWNLTIPAFLGLGDYTFMACGNVGGNFAEIMSQSQSTGNQLFGFGIIATVGETSIIFYDGTNLVSSVNTPSSTLPNFIIAITAAYNGDIKFYIDGKFVNSDGPFVPTSTSGLFKFGHDQDSGVLGFGNYTLGDGLIWKKILPEFKIFSYMRYLANTYKINY